MEADFDIQEQTTKVLRRGPDRVVINSDGEAVGSRRAREDHGISPDIIFIRNDGWALGAPRGLEGVAFKMWMREWVAFVRKPDTVGQPILKYEGRVG